MGARRNTPPLTDKVRQAIEELIADNPDSKAKSYLAAMLEAHACRGALNFDQSCALNNDQGT